MKFLLVVLNDIRCAVGLLQLVTYINEHKHSAMLMGDESYKLLFNRPDFDHTVKQFAPDVVGISSLTPNADHIEQFASRIKKLLGNDVLIGCGGVHATLFPKDTLTKNPSIDFVVSGDGEIPLTALLDEIQSGKCLKDISIPCVHLGGDDFTEKHDGCNDFVSRFPIPDESLLDPDSLKCYQNYPSFISGLKHRNISASRGCPYRCPFCQPTVRNVHGEIPRIQNVEDVVAEIKHLISQGVECLTFLDDYPFLNRKWLKAFALEMLKISPKIKWRCVLRGYIDDQLVDLMVKSGLHSVIIPADCGDDVMRQEIFSRNITNRQLIDMSNSFKKRNVIVHLSFICGYPEETVELLHDNKMLVRIIQPDTVGAFVLAFYPGTYFNERLDEPLHLERWSDYATYTKTGDFSPEMSARGLSAKYLLDFQNNIAAWNVVCGSEQHECRVIIQESPNNLKEIIRAFDSKNITPDMVIVRVDSSLNDIPPGLIDNLIKFRKKYDHQYVLFSMREYGLGKPVVEVATVEFIDRCDILIDQTLNAFVHDGATRYFPNESEIRYYLENNMSRFFSKPNVVAVEITNRCNFKCTKCQFHNSDSPDIKLEIMDFELFCRIIDMAAEFNPGMVINPNIGGELLSVPNYEKYFQYIKDKNLRLSFFTNAQLLTPKESDKIIKLQPDGLSISLDTMNEQLYKKKSGGMGNLKKTLGNIEYFLDANSKQKKPVSVSINFVQDDENEAEFDEFLNSWMPKVVSLTRTIQANTSDNLSISKEFSDIWNPLPICSAMWSSIFIKCNGQYALCGRLGPVKPLDLPWVESMGLKEFWNNHMDDWRNKALSLEMGFSSEFCRHCSSLYSHTVTLGYSNRTITKSIKNETFVSNSIIVRESKNCDIKRISRITWLKSLLSRHIPPSIKRRLKSLIIN